MPPMQALKARQAMDKGVQWLLSNQEEGGGWGRGSGSTPTDLPDDRPSPTAAAITGLGIKAIAQSRYPNMGQLAPAVERLRLARHDDVGISDGPMATYVVASITSALVSLQDPQFDDLIRDESTDFVRITSGTPARASNWNRTGTGEPAMEIEEDPISRTPSSCWMPFTTRAFRLTTPLSSER